MRPSSRCSRILVKVLVAAMIIGSGTLAATYELQKMKYGFFVHYVWGGSAYTVTVNSNGSTPAGLQDVANRFDAAGFANDIASFGVEYVIFTAWHANMNCLYPSHVMDSVRPGHSSQRDMIRDMITAVNAKGIKILLYTHPRDGHDFTSDAEKTATGWGAGVNTAESWNPNWTTFNFTKWNDFINGIYAEIVDRYGSDIIGLYCDEGSAAGDSYRVVDYPRLRTTIKSRNPALIMVQNYYGTVYSCDIGDKEYCKWGEFASNDGNTWPAYNIPVGTVMSALWWASRASGTSTVTYSARSIFRYTVLQAGANADGGGVQWAAGPYPGGGWETGVVSTMQQVGSYIAPIAASIKETYPSRAYPTNAGTTINNITWGVATRSTDNQIEYLHVLKPPTGSTLNLPVTADGKVFTSASMLRSGRSATLSQDASGVHLTIPEAWDSVNTVIKLTVDPASIHINLAYRKPVTASSNVGGAWDKNNAVDGVRTTGGSSMGWSSMNSLTTNHAEWILVDLDSVFLVEKIDLYPRNDGVNAGYGFPVNFTIQVSTDSVSWTTVVTRTGYPLPTGTLQSFPITPMNARYVMITGTSLRANPNDMNQYRMQFAEIEVYGQYITAVHPAAAVPLHQVYTREIFKTTLSRFMLPQGFAGRLSVYDLGGHLIKQKRVNGETIDLRRDFGIAAGGIYIIQAKTDR